MPNCSADNLLVYTFYRASPSVPIPSTPRSPWRVTPSCWDPHPPITRTPRSLVPPSLSVEKTQMTFSPSPLPSSQVLSLVFPEISPPSQGSGSTPFERQFVVDSSREWNDVNAQISPVSRRIPHPAFFSPTFLDAGGTPSTDYGLPSQDSQGAMGRVSLIAKFISAAADESATTESDIPSTASSRNCSSPLSDLSDLTPLSSPESSDRFGRGYHARSSLAPASPSAGRPKNLMRSRTHISTSGEESPLSRLTRSSRSPDSDYQPATGITGCKRKRASRSRGGDEAPAKRRNTPSVTSPHSTPTNGGPALETLARRLPTDIICHPQFPLFYLRFPASSYLRLADGTFPLLSAGSNRPAGAYNEPRDALDLYTPRFVKGRGATKVGACPICIESPSRGGKGEVLWFSMKFSAYKVMSSIGISSTSARPFSPPVAFRTTERPHSAKNERTSIQEGKCHKCKKWILVESIKNLDIKVKELYWWKHAAACHRGTNVEGDDDFFLDDDIYHRAQQFSSRDP